MIITLIVRHLLKKALDHRWDGAPSLPYYKPDDLGLEEERFSFMDGKYQIDGSRYWVKGKEPQALVIVFHGIGAGRNAYLKEIAVLAKQGYLVYSYDNLGCMRSEGKGIQSLGRVYKTQEKFFAWLDKDPKAMGLRRFSFGHSWGGYASLLATNPAYHIEKCVCLSGLLKPSDACYRTLNKRHLGVLKLPIHLAILSLSGKNSDVDVRKMLRQTKAKVLYIIGEKDPLVTKEFNGDILFKEFETNPNFIYKTIPGSGHGVMYAPEAEQYQNDLTRQGLTAINAPDGLAMDIEKATKHNDKVISYIIDFLKD